MLFRLAQPLANRTLLKFVQRNPQFVWSAATSTTVAKPSASAVASGERDLVNFPRPVMKEYGGKVRIAFIPDEWFQFFYKKTGVTGPYLFGAGLITFLCSKEWYIMEHEYYMGIGLVIFWTTIIKTFGPRFEVIVDKHSEADLKETQDSIDAEKQQYIDAIQQEEKEQWVSQAQNVLFDAKKENVGLQLEAEYRKRMQHAYEEVKKKLDYHVQAITTTRQVHHKHMVNWIIDNVVRSISPQQEEEALKKCIADLKTLSAR